MGMYDHVNFQMPCPTCGETVTGFQSKDGPCEMKTVQPWEVFYFYSACEHCKTWIEFQYTQPRPDHEPDRTLTREEVEALGFAMKVERKPTQDARP